MNLSSSVLALLLETFCTVADCILASVVRDSMKIAAGCVIGVWNGGAFGGRSSMLVGQDREL